jgi:hypothetical protein
MSWGVPGSLLYWLGEAATLARTTGQVYSVEHDDGSLWYVHPDGKCYRMRGAS